MWHLSEVAPKSKHALTEAEKKEIVSKFDDPEALNTYLIQLSKSVRAVQGRRVESGPIVTRLTDPHNILERSRFPTYSTIQLQVYLRTLNVVYGDVAQSCEDWANLLAEGLISYKGGSRQEWTEQLKASGGAAESQNIYLGRESPTSMQPQKKRFWQRQPKPEFQELREK